MFNFSSNNINRFHSFSFQPSISCLPTLYETYSNIYDTSTTSTTILQFYDNFYDPYTDFYDAYTTCVYSVAMDMKMFNEDLSSYALVTQEEFEGNELGLTPSEIQRLRELRAAQ